MDLRIRCSLLAARTSLSHITPVIIVTMRSTLILVAILGTASARRSPAATTTAIGPSPRILDLGQPYYPFGWGLDDSYFGVPEEFQIHEQGEGVSKMKEVKRDGEFHCNLYSTSCSRRSRDKGLGIVSSMPSHAMPI